MTHPLPELIIPNKLLCHHGPLYLLCKLSAALYVGVMMGLLINFFISAPPASHKQEELYPDGASASWVGGYNRQVKGKNFLWRRGRGRLFLVDGGFKALELIGLCMKWMKRSA